MHAGTYPRVGVTAARAESPFGVMTMSVHKLTAGSGYDYLTRQVAALDATEKGHTGLAAYYTERGESPEPCLAAVCTRWLSCGSSSWKGPTSPCATFKT
jgi:hypothetical protein